jgi:hypothetical protein
VEEELPLVVPDELEAEAESEAEAEEDALAESALLTEEALVDAAPPAPVAAPEPPEEPHPAAMLMDAARRANAVRGAIETMKTSIRDKGATRPAPRFEPRGAAFSDLGDRPGPANDSAGSQEKDAVHPAG